mmetsp:Transcript_16421/g.46577  ORF Transcript_16421/g.46577 Transcript_16421/m.46577 type:complete len:272 (-) Transcript_16421:142-957(-)
MCHTRMFRSKPPVTNDSPPNQAQQQTPCPWAKIKPGESLGSPSQPVHNLAVASADTVTRVVFFLSSCLENAQSKTAPSWPSSSWTSDNAESRLSRHLSARSNVPRVATRTTPSEPPQATRPLPPDDTHHNGPPQTCLAWTTSTRHPGAPMNSSLRAASTLRDASGANCLRTKLIFFRLAASKTSSPVFVPAALTAASTSSGDGCRTSPTCENSMVSRLVSTTFICLVFGGCWLRTASPRPSSTSGSGARRFLLRFLRLYPAGERLSRVGCV